MAKNQKNKNNKIEKKQEKGYISPTKRLSGKVFIIILVVAMVIGIITGLGFAIYSLITTV